MAINSGISPNQAKNQSSKSGKAKIKRIDEIIARIADLLEGRLFLTLEKNFILTV